MRAGPLPPLAALAALSLGSFAAAAAPDVDLLSGRRTVFLGDSITQAGGYVSFAAYYLDRLHPQKRFDIIGLGLSSETLSGLSEPGHARGAFPRPCLFERLARLLEKARPEVVVACYGMNDGIYMPLDAERFDRFKKGVTRLIEDCRAAGVKDIVLVTPPIYDAAPESGAAGYDSVLAAYAEWENSLKLPGVRVIDLHAAMRRARDARREPFSKDRVHPGDDGHLLMARTILSALGVKVPDETAERIKADPLFRLVDKRRRLRSERWMRHVGYTRERTVAPEPLGTAETEAAKLQEEIDALRRSR